MIYRKSNIRTPIEINNNRNNRTIDIRQKCALHIWPNLLTTKRKKFKYHYWKIKFFYNRNKMARYCIKIFVSHHCITLTCPLCQNNKRYSWWLKCPLKKIAILLHILSKIHIELLALYIISTCEDMKVQFDIILILKRIIIDSLNQW